MAFSSPPLTASLTLCLDVALVRTAFEHGALPLNLHARDGDLPRRRDDSLGDCSEDKETGEEFVIRTKMVFNAAGALG